MTFHAMTERYEEITVCGKPALFTSIRIRRDTIPDGLYAYDVRHDDECRGIPCEIAPFVMANARTRLHKSFLVMQDVNYQLFSDSVREEILLGAAHPKLVDTVMQALGLNGLADRHPMSLSGGQKQRVVVAAAMLSDKPLILLDEPTSGLDRGNMEQVGRLLQQLKTQGKTIVVITHDEELAADWCDRIIALQD